LALEQNKSNTLLKETYLDYFCNNRRSDGSYQQRQ